MYLQRSRLRIFFFNYERDGARAYLQAALFCLCKSSSLATKVIEEHYTANQLIHFLNINAVVATEQHVGFPTQETVNVLLHFVTFPFKIEQNIVNSEHYLLGKDFPISDMVKIETI